MMIEKISNITLDTNEINSYHIIRDYMVGNMSKEGENTNPGSIQIQDEHNTFYVREDYSSTIRTTMVSYQRENQTR